MKKSATKSDKNTRTALKSVGFLAAGTTAAGAAGAAMLMALPDCWAPPERMALEALVAQAAPAAPLERAAPAVRGP